MITCEEALSLKSHLTIFETLANEKRLEIYEFILQQYFVSKSELAIEMALNRASLNHHLKSLITAQLVKEIELIIEGRKQNFIFILKAISLTELINDIPDSGIVSSTMDKLENKRIVFESWPEIRQSLEKINVDFLEAIESRLFKHVSKIGSTCGICNDKTSISTCKSCFTALCKNCQHVIKREEGEVILCQNCIKLYFG